MSPLLFWQLFCRFFSGIIYYSLSNLIREVGTGLKVGNGMGGHGDGRIVFDATSHFLGPLFRAKAPKLADIDRFTLANSGLDHLKKGLDDRSANLGINTGLLANSTDYLLFGHGL